MRSLLNIELSGTSTYSRIKNISVNPNSSGVKELLKTIKELDSICKNVDLSFLSESKLRCFSLEVQRSDKYRIDRFHNRDKKDAYLAMFIYFKRKEFVDMVIEATSTYAHTVMRRSRKKSREYNIKNQSKYKLNSEKLKEVIKNILEIKQIEELQIYQNELLPLREELESQENEMEEIDFLVKSHQSFNYTNELLECIEFNSNTKPEFINYLRKFSSFKNKKKIDVDINIFSSQWQKKIKRLNYSKKAIEIALLYSIRDHIRSGDIFVKESRKYNSFDHYLIESQKEINTQEAIQFIKKLKPILNIPKNFEINTEIIQDEKSNFSDKIYGYFPKISITCLW